MPKKMLFSSLILLLALLCLLTVSCSDDNKSSTEPETVNINGYWTGIITIDVDFDFELDISQTGTRLSGTFIYINTGYTWEYPLLSTSSINDNKVYINFDQPDYRTRLTGTVNSAGDAMQGTYTINGNSYSNSVWQASR